MEIIDLTVITRLRRIIVTFIIFGLITNSNSSPNKNERNFNNKCCSNSQNLLVNVNCVGSGNNSEINLKCENRYLIDPEQFEEDSFNISENGSLHLIHVDEYILLGEYCIANSYDNETDEITEVALACFDMKDVERQRILSFVKAFLIMVSVLFLITTLYVYYLLPELRETQDKVTIWCIVCLTVFMFFLGILQISNPLLSLGTYCVIIAFLVYFFSIAYFAWLNTVLANLFKLVVFRKWKIPELKWYLLNHMYVWTIACGMTFVVLASHAIEPTFGVMSCWFEKPKEQWIYLYTPISIMLGINVVLFIFTSISLSKSGNDISPDKRKVLKYKIILYLKLFLLGGMTWIFEVLSYLYDGDHSQNSWFWFCIDVINCLQGVLIFFVLVLGRPRIKKELAGKCVIFFRAPRRWADYEHDDEEFLENNSDKGKYDLIIR